LDFLSSELPLISQVLKAANGGTFQSQAPQARVLIDELAQYPLGRKDQGGHQRLTTGLLERRESAKDGILMVNSHLPQGI
jgi:hypothetical protein